MDAVEVEAKTYEEAIRKASLELNAEEKDMDIEVKEVDTKGILGLLGSKKVRITAKIRNTPEDYAKKFLADLADYLGLTLTITVITSSDRVIFNIDSSDEEAIIGKDGEVLDALQYLTRLAVAKKYKENLKLLIDVNGFREKRKKEIIAMARRLADKVKRGGRPIKTKPLNPYERRIIHTLFKNSTDITTMSEGDGHTKKMVIAPSKTVNARR
ncbi:MAG TPA: protein jag [Deltaproteobacteria bacterium]|nr:protein jag [Deltaproteobacteria bacterium]